MRDRATFRAKIRKIGINPYVLVPKDVLATIFEAAKKDRGPIPVTMTIDGHRFTQTLVRYAGAWRLYLNGPMREAAQRDVGDTVTIEIAFDPKPPAVPMEPAFGRALARNAKARAAFEALPPSHRKEILRYLGSLKSEEARARNIQKVLARLVSTNPRAAAAGRG